MGRSLREARYSSWGRYPRASPARVVPIVWRSELPRLENIPESVLPYACGRSYGDSCLNDKGALLDVSGLDRMIAFDETEGLLRCEAGVTLAQILAFAVPRGWFPAVLPGTRWVSVGGAIANDIHGKNHHRAGAFGAHVTSFELLRSTGDRVICSRSEHPDLFRATIGGLGLTGVILWAELRLERVAGSGIRVERIRFGSLDEFFSIAEEDSDHEYTVAWVDCVTGGRRLGRGHYMRGDHAALDGHTTDPLAKPAFQVPCEAPHWLLNKATVKTFNGAYYHRQLRRRTSTVVPYIPFFFPLDGVGAWGRLYGQAGFLQYQCVVPDEQARRTTGQILERIVDSGQAAPLAVLKRFGAAPAEGLLSFTRPGVTLAVDFAFRGDATLRLLDSLDAIVTEAGGAVYPAKDARMSAESFRRFFPACEAFARQADPKFSSSFWRRVYS